jgi:hypothetical protein
MATVTEARAVKVAESAAQERRKGSRPWSKAAKGAPAPRETRAAVGGDAPRADDSVWKEF